MSIYFLDTSALIKRYLTETGSSWIRSLIEESGTTITAAEVTRVEAAAAIAARHRAPKGISQQERDDIVAAMLRHFDQQYQLISLTSVTLEKAVDLTQNHRLRGYDAIQLSVALTANQSLRQAGLPGLIFVAADRDLLAAAQQEGLEIKNPNDHPV
jgi:uncharacterized protein